MPSCLGLYIENNLIKYAKVSKNNETVKVESFGVKFYDNINSAINKIIEETCSFKTPISINTTDEIYNNIEVFSLLSKKDIDSVIKTEFENICYEKDINKNIYEERHIITPSNTNNDKIKVIHVATPKTAIEQRKKEFEGYKISSIVPLSISIANIVKKEKKRKILVVNIEKNTVVTKIVNGNVVDIDILQIGAKDILDKINKKENSYSKAYEICKAATIYTESDKDLQYEENEYLEDIMPTLYEIVNEVKKITDENIENIEKIYITGTGAIINNIDIYFQDNLRNINCEILKPNFINGNSKINIKDYIEVNSAVSIGLQALGKTTNNINFVKESSIDKVLNVLNSNVSFGKEKSNQNIKNNETINKINNVVGKINLPYNTTFFTLLFATVIYISGTCILNMQLDNKIAKTQETIDNTNTKIQELTEYNKIFNSKITEYETLISNIQSLNDANSEDKRYRNTIPNLLNNIMAVIPKNVQLSSIENTSGTHIVIVATSSKYEQIAFFKTKLKTEEILKNVVSDTGTTSGGTLRVTIEGDLP